MNVLSTTVVALCAVPQHCMSNAQTGFDLPTQLHGESRVKTIGRKHGPVISTKLLLKVYNNQFGFQTRSRVFLFFRSAEPSQKIPSAVGQSNATAIAKPMEKRI